MTERGDRKRDYDSTDADQSDFDDSEDYQEFVEESSSESEADIECINWDLDTKILHNAFPPLLVGCHLMPTCCNWQNKSNPSKKKKFSAYLNPALTTTECLPSLQNCWNNGKPLANESIEIVIDPFKVCIVKNMLGEVEFLDELRQECYELNFNLRTMDLYEFFQTRDLKYLNSQRITAIYDFLKGEAMSWVSAITGYEFTDISATCSLYTSTDYLLVHDDQREDRKVAFILYLTDCDGWSEKNGGTLQLLSKDANGQPFEVVRNILPSNNHFIFFPVTNDSYHQVEEVVGLNKYRLSINGWFHVKEAPVFSIPHYNPVPHSLYSDNYQNPKVVDIDLHSWINDEYLDPKIIKSIQKHIEENSEISLKQFLRKESFTEVLENLKLPDVVWKKVGPPNRFLYETIQQESVPHIIERMLDLFRSTVMFELLKAYTDLDLTAKTASMKLEVQRWTPRNYALLTDYDWKRQNELDLIMYFGCGDRADVIGARTQYITMEDEVQHALITIEPEENSLNVVYRDSARFTKYFSVQSKCQQIYILICSYTE